MSEKSAVIRRFLGDERLMLRVSGTALGFPAAILLLSMMFYGLEIESFWWQFGSSMMRWAWSGVVLFFLYHVKRIGAVTVIFAALVPWLMLLMLPFLWPLYYVFPFESLLLRWICIAASAMLPVVSIEYVIKLFLRHRGGHSERS